MSLGGKPTLLTPEMLLFFEGTVFMVFYLIEGLKPNQRNTYYLRQRQRRKGTLSFLQTRANTASQEEQTPYSPCGAFIQCVNALSRVLCCRPSARARWFVLVSDGRLAAYSTGTAGTLAARCCLYCVRTSDGSMMRVYIEECIKHHL
jgi:hypothetical protein